MVPLLLLKSHLLLRRQRSSPAAAAAAAAGVIVEPEYTETDPGFIYHHRSVVDELLLFKMRRSSFVDVINQELIYSIIALYMDEVI